jgi:vacuolar-type H+-ATPase subunit I/STV1
MRFAALARRPWTAAAVGAAVFTPMFWLSVATGVGRLTVAHGHHLGAYPAAVVSLYFAAVIVIGPLLAFTAGYALDRLTAAWRTADAVAMFVAFGVVLAAAAVSLVMALAPNGGAFTAAFWLFGLPLPVTLGVTRLAMDSVLSSPAWTRAAAAVALGPVLLAALVCLGLYVSHATIPA